MPLTMISKNICADLDCTDTLLDKVMEVIEEEVSSVTLLRPFICGMEFQIPNIYECIRDARSVRGWNVILEGSVPDSILEF